MDRAVRMAASIHMIHVASLLHERLGDFPLPDQQEPDPLHMHHQQESLDILLGDLFFSKAACIIIEDGQQPIVEDMIRTSLASAETQAVIEGMEQEPASTGPSRCFLALADKLSLILALALRTGARLGNAPEAESRALSDYGTLLGRVLRIAEDLRFWSGLPASGKALPRRIRFNHPLLLLWEEEGGKAWTGIAEALRTPDEGTLQEVRVRLDEQGYLKASADKMKAVAREAVSHLDQQEGLKGMDELGELVHVRLVRYGRAGGEIPR